MPQIRTGKTNSAKQARKQAQDTDFAALIAALESANNFAQLKPHLTTLAQVLRDLAKAVEVKQ